MIPASIGLYKHICAHQHLGQVVEVLPRQGIIVEYMCIHDPNPNVQLPIDVLLANVVAQFIFIRRKAEAWDGIASTLI